MQGDNLDEWQAMILLVGGLGYAAKFAHKMVVSMALQAPWVLVLDAMFVLVSKSWNWALQGMYWYWSGLTVIDRNASADVLESDFAWWWQSRNLSTGGANVVNGHAVVWAVVLVVTLLWQECCQWDYCCHTSWFWDKWTVWCTQLSCLSGAVVMVMALVAVCICMVVS